MTTLNACPRCGAPLAAGARFCSRCGYDASGEQAIATEKMPGISIPIPTTPASTTDVEGEVDPQAGLIDDLRRATLGEFDIATELGRGGMATVFLAHEIALDRKVAIKVMSPSLLSSGKGMADRFKREARTAAKLSHPHIIPIYGVRESGKLLFFVMKYIEGRPLDAIIKEHGALPVKMVLAIIAQAGAALDYAHRNGVVHRDIKPANIMVDIDGWTIVTDFGIAKVRESQGLTMTGATIGTPTYMSPEQCSAKEITGATDQYSLGIAAYEMLTGKVPFDADSVMSLMWQHFHEPPPPLLERRPDCPPALAQAVERMLAKAPADRWSSLEEAIEVIGTPAASDPIRQQMKKMARGSVAPITTSPRTPLSPVPKFTTPPPTAAAPVQSSTPPPAAATSAPTTPIPATNEPAELREPPAPRLPSTPLEPISPTVASREITDSPTAILASTPVPPTAPPKARSVATPPSLPPLPRGIPEAPPPPRRRPSGRSKPAMPAPTVAPVAGPKRGRGLKWIGLVAAVLVIGAGAWAMFVRTPGGAPAPAPAPAANANTPAAPAAPVASITVIPSSTALAVGDSAQLAAVLMDASRSILASAGHTVVWKSGDTTRARVSPTGLVQARAAGRVDVIATSEGQSDTGAVVITTVAAPVASVEILGPSAIASGDTAVLTAHPKDAQGNVLSGRSIAWGTSDRTIATVSPSGSVRALRLGAVTISALVEKKAATTRLTITPVAVASVTIAPPEASLQIGARTQLVATPHDARNRTLVGRPVRWSSGASAIATVSPTGVVTGVAAGQTMITARIESQTAQATISVALVPVATVTLAPTTLTLAAGKSSQISVTLKDARGATIRDRDVTWATSDPSIAGVSPTGLVTATRAGAATITATAENARAMVTVTVPAPPAPPPAVANNPPAESQPPAVTPPVQTNPPPETARVVVRRGVTSGGQHTCALTSAGAVACWGSNEFGQMADPAAGAASNVPILINGVSGATLLAAGNNHTCALADGSAICWGANLKGQLGNGRTAPASTPVAVIGGHVFQSIVAGARHTCGLGSDGVAWCWGDNDNGQLGNGTTHGNATPQRVTGTTRFRMLAAGSDHSCGLGTDGRVYCWGDGFSGQLGRGSREATTEPNPVDGDVKFTSLTAGGKHACALAVSGKAYCWGANVAGEIGDGSKSERDAPVLVSGAHAFTALAAGFEHTCGLTSDGDVYCWGRNREGQVGDGTRVDKQAPVKVSTSAAMQSIGAGGNHTCGVTAAGVLCWGGNIKGQLGDASVTARLTPVSVESGH